MFRLSNTFSGIKSQFFGADSFPNDRASRAAADMFCVNTCPELDTVTDEGDKYRATHDALIKRQEFLSEIRAEIGDKWYANKANGMTTSEQKQVIGRGHIYVFEAEGEQTAPKLSVSADPADVEAYAEAVQTASSDFFRGVAESGCLTIQNKAFTFGARECGALVGFPDNNGCDITTGEENRKDNIFSDECPSAANVVCRSQKLINIATRMATDNSDFEGVTCGAFDNDIALWMTADDNERIKIKENCCELRSQVKVLGCAFGTDEMQSNIAVNVIGKSLKSVAQSLFHGADRGEGMPPDGKCDIAYVGTGRQLAISFNSADGRFLQQGKIEDLDADVAIAAVATKSFAESLTSWDVSDKADDFDAKFHNLKFNGKQRRGFNKVRGQIEDMLNREIPLPGGISFQTLETSDEFPEAGGDVVMTDVRVNWFKDKDLAKLDTSSLEGYIANVLIGFGLEAEEYRLKTAEFAFLTTSTTTTTYENVTAAPTTTTGVPEASGTVTYVTDKDGLVICRGGTLSCEEEEDKVVSLESQIMNLKDAYTYDNSVTRSTIAKTTADVEDMDEDLKTLRGTYESMKTELDRCDNLALDIPGTVQYPRECGEEKKAYDAAANAFVKFAVEYDIKYAAAAAAKVAAEQALFDIRTAYFESLTEMVDYNPRKHDNEESKSYKGKEEIEDIFSNFDLILDEVEEIKKAIQDLSEEMARAKTAVANEQSTETRALNKQLGDKKAALDKCMAVEEVRLADVPTAILEPGTPIYNQEMALKQETMKSTCAPQQADYDLTVALVDSSATKYANALTAAENVILSAESLVEDIEEYEDEDAFDTKASLEERNKADKALPAWLLAVIAVAAVLIIGGVLYLTVFSSSDGGDQQYYSNRGDNGRKKSKKSKGRGGSLNGRGHSTIAFDNPVYTGEDDQAQDTATFDAEQEEVLYDEPEQGVDAPTGGGYLDVQPDGEGDESSEEVSSSEDDE